MGSNMQPRYISVKSHMSPSVTGKGNDSVLADGKWFHKFLRYADFYLATRNPPKVQVKLISGYLECLLEFGKLECPLDLTEEGKNQMASNIFISKLSQEE